MSFIIRSRDVNFDYVFYKKESLLKSYFSTDSHIEKATVFENKDEALKVLEKAEKKLGVLLEVVEKIEPKTIFVIKDIYLFKGTVVDENSFRFNVTGIEWTPYIQRKDGDKYFFDKKEALKGMIKHLKKLKSNAEFILLQIKSAIENNEEKLKKLSKASKKKTSPRKKKAVKQTAVEKEPVKEKAKKPKKAVKALAKAVKPTKKAVSTKPEKVVKTAPKAKKSPARPKKAVETKKSKEPEKKVKAPEKVKTSGKKKK